jgi:nicotinamidase-related amidase
MVSSDSRPLDAATAVLVIDVQVGLITGAYQEAAVLDRINEAIKKARQGGGEIVFVQHCHTTFDGLKKGAPGWRLDPRLERTRTDMIVEKQASDAFCATNLDEVLQARGIRRVLVTGLQTEYCVDTTCRAALSRGYEVTLVSDAHTTGESHLSAATIIDHHNRLLSNLAYPGAGISVRPCAEL